ncbi:NAD(+)--rifampin ADP-ribosyltransferase [Lactococcus fujiensis]|uniref:Rifampin ADP-ribosyl transferase n=1 Tax=Lactococcus fujiensis JCM 16395 TaxID=1291764 RepID=A0A2A5RKP0_9LACT|nr:NAD(+)--rifampin ADP-ribosyltransferase [Lactococcus fujiensis]PCR99758.1 rifampin ADP-ribosyl transferase [Lactococcus fujiensis JCM 16395]
MPENLDRGPFYHGTKAKLANGTFLTAGHHSNYNKNVVMNHVYFTALKDGAGLAAELAQGDTPPHVYLIEPTGPFENDPNVTDKKFPGNPTRSYRSEYALKIIDEVEDYQRITAEQKLYWQAKMANPKPKSEIIN